MNPTRTDIRGSIDNPTRWFLFALAAVMLALWFPFIPNWQTFIHIWRVELAASVLLACTLAYVCIHSKIQLKLHDEEWRFIVLPILAFVVWSMISAIWAPSWKSAIHHSLVWGEYLILYIIFRQMLERNGMQTRLAAVFVLTLLLYALPATIEYCAYLVFGGSTTIGIRFAKYGEQVVTIIPLVLIWTARARRKTFLIRAGIVCGLWLLVFCSLGRTNYLLFAAGSLAVFGGVLLSRHYRPHARRLALAGALVVLAPISLHVFTVFSANGANPAMGRFTDTDAFASSGNFRTLMISLSGEMIRKNPVTGVGADNFGMQVNEYRRAYGAANPDYAHLAAAESEIPNHAHNEFLQIVAELGLVGGRDLRVVSRRRSDPLCTLGKDGAFGIALSIRRRYRAGSVSRQLDREFLLIPGHAKRHRILFRSCGGIESSFPIAIRNRFFPCIVGLADPAFRLCGRNTRITRPGVLLDG